MYKFIFVLLVINTFFAAIRAETVSCGKNYYCSNSKGIYLTAGKDIAFFNYSDKFKIRNISLPEEVLGGLTRDTVCLIQCNNEKLEIISKQVFQYKIENETKLTFIKKYPRSPKLSSNYLIGGSTTELFRNEDFKIILNFEHRESHIKTKYGDITHFDKTTLLKIDLKTGKKVDEYVVSNVESNESIH